MAFKIRVLNHTPQWYHDHCREEDGGSPAFRAMLKNDMAFLGADNDSTLTYQEKVDTYEETWNRIIGNSKSEDPNGVLTGEIAKVMEREALKDSRPEDEFKGEPYNAISELMLKHGINAETIRHFLKWRSRQKEIQKREKAIEEKRKEGYRQANELLVRFRKKRPGKPSKQVKPIEFFDYEEEPKLPVVEQEPPESQESP
jgi:hypothetical protein